MRENTIRQDYMIDRLKECMRTHCLFILLILSILSICILACPALRSGF
jgi:hypothetical protein